jgi:hypothetical protein
MIKEMYLEKGKMISIMKWNGGRMNQGWRGKSIMISCICYSIYLPSSFAFEPHRTRWYIGLVLICGDSLPYFNQLLVAKPAYFNQLQVSMA